MSILIKGMEMTTSCGYCPLRHEARDGDECYLGASLTEYQKRPDDCPLVPIQPHGRLIDADEFLKRAIGTKCFHGDYALMLEELVVESATIIPAEPAEDGEI